MNSSFPTQRQEQRQTERKACLSHRHQLGRHANDAPPEVAQRSRVLTAKVLRQGPPIPVQAEAEQQDRRSFAHHPACLGQTSHVISTLITHLKNIDVFILCHEIISHSWNQETFLIFDCNLVENTEKSSNKNENDCN